MIHVVISFLNIWEAWAEKSWKKTSTVFKEKQNMPSTLPTEIKYTHKPGQPSSIKHIESWTRREQYNLYTPIIGILGYKYLHDEHKSFGLDICDKTAKAFYKHVTVCLQRNSNEVENSQVKSGWYRQTLHVDLTIKLLQWQAEKFCISKWLACKISTAGNLELKSWCIKNTWTQQNWCTIEWQVILYLQSINYIMANFHHDRPNETLSGVFSVFIGSTNHLYTYLGLVRHQCLTEISFSPASRV